MTLNNLFMSLYRYTSFCIEYSLFKGFSAAFDWGKKAVKRFLNASTGLKTLFYPSYLCGNSLCPFFLFKEL